MQETHGEKKQIKRNPMRVGVVREVPKDRERGRRDEDEEDYIARLSYCINCKEKRVVLLMLPYKKTTMRVCVNPQCFLETKIEQLTTWVRE